MSFLSLFSDEPYNLDDPVWDMNVLTGALKLFFRELKEPLFTYSLFDKFLSNYSKLKYFIPFLFVSFPLLTGN